MTLHLPHLRDNATLRNPMWIVARVAYYVHI